MQSPLPDSSALEAGIIEDSRPSRLSRVQDNVRNLLRNSLSHRNSIMIPSPSRNRAYMDEGYESSTTSPITPLHPPMHQRPEVLPSPTQILPTSVHARREMLPTPPPSPRRNHEPIVSQAEFSPVSIDEEEEVENTTPTSQTALHPTRSFHAALDHPDLSIASLGTFHQHKRQHHQQRHPARSTRHRGLGKHGMEKQRVQRKRQARMMASQTCLCVIAGLLLAAVVATYLSLAITASSPLTPTFHILFILGVLLATIVFSHTLVRICLLHRGLAGSTRFFLVRQEGNNKVAVGRKGELRKPSSRQHHHVERSRRVPHQQHHIRIRSQVGAEEQIMARPDELERQVRASREFLPPTPIQVHVASDIAEMRESPSQAFSIDRQAAIVNAWDRPVHEIANPPPAYGRWRGSVRADPNLLHWQAIPSPVSPESGHVLPSPTYEQVMAEDQSNAGMPGTSPPSYATRDVDGTPVRVQREDLAQAQVGGRKPEMIEIAGVGLAV